MTQGGTTQTLWTVEYDRTVSFPPGNKGQDERNRQGNINFRIHQYEAELGQVRGTIDTLAAGSKERASLESKALALDRAIKLMRTRHSVAGLMAGGSDSEKVTDDNNRVVEGAVGDPGELSEKEVKQLGARYDLCSTAQMTKNNCCHARPSAPGGGGTKFGFVQPVPTMPPPPGLNVWVMGRFE